MNWTYRLLLVATFLPLCWLGMQVVHELGHVVGAMLTNAQIERVVLHPITLSRTDVIGGAHPQAVVWAGPCLGVSLPLAIWGWAALLRWRAAFLARFFAGFCLIANGAYIAGGSLSGIGDAGELLRHGAPLPSLWLFGLVTIPAGLALWNGLAPDFGIGPHARPVPPSLAVGCLIALVGLVVAEAAYSAL